MVSPTSALTMRPRPDLGAGAATGLAGGVYVTSAPLLGGPVGMPGEAVRYLLLTGLLLAGAVGWAVRRRGRAGPATAAARRAVGVCLLAGVAPLLAALCGSAMVFAVLLVMAAALAGGSLGLYRPAHSWHAACWAGAAAGGGVTVLLAQRPEIACALGCGLAALLLVPACGRAAAPGDSRGGRAVPSRWTAGAVGAAVCGAVFAGQSLVVFRWELLGGAGVRPLACAALLAAALTCGLAAAARRLPVGGAALAGGGAVLPDRSVAPPDRSAALPDQGAALAGGGAVLPDRGAALPDRGVVLFASGLTASVAACAGAARPWQLMLALAAVLTCGAAAVTGRAGSPVARGAQDAGYAVALLLGGAAAMTAVVLSGRLLGGPDTLVAIGSAPAVATAATLLRRRRGPAADPDTAGAAGGTAIPALRVRGLGVRAAEGPAVRRLQLTVAAGEIAYLTDSLPGRRAGAVLAVLGGLRRADAGTWWLRGHDVSRVAEPGRWDLRMSALVDPADMARAGVLHRGHPAVSVADAVADATAHLGQRRAAEVTPGVLAAFPFLETGGAGACVRLGPDERCFLGLAQTLIAQPTLLLLDLTGPGCGPLTRDPGVSAVLRQIADRGTAVLVAVPAGQAVPGPRPIVLPAPGGFRAALLRRNGKAMP
ncbi:hypothetical protein [Streptomyces sp. cmx-4-9]|uniref:hypothetical protein n=1 Tax=Streptomyces sp. cmx-4-9 TaxID=2790941 RepID=UPI00397F41C9